MGGPAAGPRPLPGPELPAGRPEPAVQRPEPGRPEGDISGQQCRQTRAEVSSQSWPVILAVHLGDMHKLRHGMGIDQILHSPTQPKLGHTLLSSKTHSNTTTQ